MKWFCLIGLAGILLMTGCGGEDGAGGQVMDISATEAVAMIASNQGSASFVVLDVRTPAEYAESHVTGALLIDFNAGNFATEIESLDKTRTYVVYCRSGGRSASATDMMVAAGFTTVYNVLGGMLDIADVPEAAALVETGG